MAPNVTSTSLPCHLIRVWHKQLHLTGLCFAKLLLCGDDPSHERAHVASPVWRDHQPGASPRGMRGREGQGTEAESSLRSNWLQQFLLLH